MKKGAAKPPGRQEAAPQPDVPRQQGGQSTRTIEQENEIVAWIESGEPLRAYCRLPGKRSKSTIYRWEKADAAFAGRLADAREVGEHELLEEARQIMDTTPATGPGNGLTEEGKIDPAWVQLQFRRAEIRLKLVAVFNPRKYGGKMGAAEAGKKADIPIAERIARVQALIAVSEAAKASKKKR